MYVLGVWGSTFWVHKQLKIPLSLSLSDSQSIIVAPSQHLSLTYLILSQEVFLSSVLHGFLSFIILLFSSILIISSLGHFCYQFPRVASYAS